jgi:transcription antitermination factor NusG
VDQRDDQTWVVIELNHLGETKVDEGTLENSLRRDLDVQSEFPIFIPVLSYPKGNRTINFHLMEGYVFVGSGLADTAYFALERKDYVNQVITTPGRVRSLNVIPNTKIEELRKQLRQMVSADIQDGAEIRVLNGPYRNLEGIIIMVALDAAIVRIQLRSLDLIVTIPKVFLEALQNPDESE